MRLLLNENVSWRLAAYLRPHCEVVLHVRDVGLDKSLIRVSGATPGSMATTC